MLSFYIVDDDRGIINVLADIINNNNLGEIVGASESGGDAIDDIIALKPDIILLDYLLDDTDGLEIINSISKFYNYNIIMISEVSSKEMIAKAYKLGIEFFISKPINVIEVVSIIKKVEENILLREVVNKFEVAYSSLNSNFRNIKQTETNSSYSEIKKVLGTLGIVGETGCEELIKAITWVKHNEDTEYKLSDVYKGVSEEYENKIQIHAIEKRLRRIVLKTFNEIAERGGNDYYDIIFETYSSKLFDFSEIHKQINYLRGKSKLSGKINVRKFIEGIATDIR